MFCNVICSQTAQIFSTRTFGLLLPRRGTETGRLFQIMFQRGILGLLLPKTGIGTGQLFGKIAPMRTEIGRLF